MSWFDAKQVVRHPAAPLLPEQFQMIADKPLVLSGAFPAAFSTPYAVPLLVRALATEAGDTSCHSLDPSGERVSLAELLETLGRLPGGRLFENFDALHASPLMSAAFAGLPFAGPCDGMQPGCSITALLLLSARGGSTPLRRLPGRSAWFLIVDGSATAYLQETAAPAQAGDSKRSARWQASLAPGETLMVPDGWTFQIAFGAEKNLAILSPFVPASRLPPDASGPPIPRALPPEFLYRSAVGPIHLQERHAFLTAFHSAARRYQSRDGPGLCAREAANKIKKGGSGPWPASGCVVRVISLQGRASEARRRMMDNDMLRPVRAELGADIEFFDAVNGRELSLCPELMGTGGKQRCMYHRLPSGRELWAEVDAQYWVGLADEDQRQAHIERHASMFAADLDRQAFVHGVYEPATPALGMVGNHLSHSALWHEIDEMGVPWALLVEDDAVVHPELSTSWPEIVAAVAAEVHELGEDWDVLFVGRMLSGTPEGCAVTAVTVEVGWTLRTHCYAVSRRGVQRLIRYGLDSHVFHCAMDEVLAAMAAGQHWHEAFDRRLRELGCLGQPLRILGFKFEGVVFQLMDVETSDRSQSLCVGEGAEKI